MKKYIIYRCPENCTCHQKLKKHELIGVLEGADLFDLDDNLEEIIKSDLQSFVMDMFFKGNVDIYDISVEPQSKKYKYSLSATFVPESENAQENITREYGIQEKEI